MRELQAFKQNIEHGHAGLGPKFDVIAPQCPIAAKCASAIGFETQDIRRHCCEHLRLPIKKKGNGYTITCNRITDEP